MENLALSCDGLPVRGTGVGLLCVRPCSAIAAQLFPAIRICVDEGLVVGTMPILVLIRPEPSAGRCTHRRGEDLPQPVALCTAALPPPFGSPLGTGQPS
jgi:hypothetical protein